MNPFNLVHRGKGDLKTVFRPQTFDEIVPTFTVSRVQAILDDPTASRVYLFEGPSGVGKTTAARIVARAATCESEGSKPCLKCASCTGDLFVEINIADFRKIDDIRDLVEGMRYAPMNGAKKVYILDEVHQLLAASQQMLLKVLEEPHEHLLIFLCTTQTKGLARTLLSRCTRIKFREITEAQAASIVAQVVVKMDHAEADLSSSYLRDIIPRAQGSVRDLLNLLDAYFKGDYRIGEHGSDDTPADIREIAKALIWKEWPKVADLLKDPKIRQNGEGTRFAVTNYLRGIVLRESGYNAGAARALGQLAGSISSEPQAEQYNLLVLKCLRVCFG